MLAAQRIVGNRRASHIIIGLPGNAGGRRCARLWGSDDTGRQRNTEDSLRTAIRFLFVDAIVEMERLKRVSASRM